MSVYTRLPYALQRYDIFCNYANVSCIFLISKSLPSVFQYLFVGIAFLFQCLYPKGTMALAKK